MAKCGGCGKFMSTTESISCGKCRIRYHRACVGLLNTGSLPTSWHCPECKKNLLRDNGADTPVRGCASVAALESSINLMDTSPINNTALDDTQELNTDFLKAELRQLKDEFLGIIRSEFQLLRDDLSQLRSLVKLNNDRLCSLEERVAIIENQKVVQPASSEVNALITQLRNDINDRDQELLANDVQISNITEVSGENPINTAMLLASKIGVKIKPRDIVSAERVGGRRIGATQSTGPVETRPRFLVVRLARRDLRDELLEAARVRRGMTTADLELPGPATRFYINERLTKVNRELFRRAREAGGSRGWQFIWSKKGRIFARNKPGDSAYHIRCEADLQGVFNLTASSNGGVVASA
ncbi:unnamed protein product [Spodoptera littoralis]|uniref:Zinc finger PHD-type domain-containing protein n=1 Tax=Spodoptera littoralis TaxID=7109 RepID=A0A9P0HVR2_SPOLI|nr:unnamed protein product [Spodoptera littoralis]CAH1636266.1 unnamed protein product [Spodoptera littoralis]